MAAESTVISWRIFEFADRNVLLRGETSCLGIPWDSCKINDEGAQKVIRLRNLPLCQVSMILMISSGQGWGQECWLNDPFAPFVKLEVSIDSGMPLLKVRNDFQKPVRVARILMMVEGEESPISLLSEPVDLPPADRHYLNFGRTLMDSIGKSAAKQEKRIRFRLSLEPEPPRQPKEFDYRVTFENQQITGCVRISSTS